MKRPGLEVIPVAGAGEGKVLWKESLDPTCPKSKVSEQSEKNNIQPARYIKPFGKFLFFKRSVLLLFMLQ
jgi:hypothetical protein